MPNLNVSEFLKNLDNLANQLGFQLIDKEYLSKLQLKAKSGSRASLDIDILNHIDEQNRSNFIKYLNHSKSQMRQDLFVLCELNFIDNGYFVEFGATDGLIGSNSYLLEKSFNWDGILCEPAKYWIKNLNSNRSVNLETKCVWESSGLELLFNETDIKQLSTLDDFSNSDGHSNNRQKGSK